MSKSMLAAFAISQMKALSAKDNKERLRFTIAGCKDGKLYDHVGTNYGVFDENAPDVVFIPESDLELTRITGVKIAGIIEKAEAFFNEYAFDKVVEVEEVEEVVEVEEVEEIVEDTVEVEEKIDTEAVEKAAKKAIKKGDFKKAQKLIDKLGGSKKLQKKLNKAKGE